MQHIIQDACCHQNTNEDQQNTADAVNQVVVASDDSTNLVKYEATDKKTGEHVVWTFNGKGNNFENMISCVRTYNGSTSTYTYNTVPWGTGMLYPPKNPGDFYF